MTNRLMNPNVKDKILFILHTPPPTHGAAKVGDYIRFSEILENSFNSKFVKIRSSSSIKNIGRFGFLKVVYSCWLFFEVGFNLIFFRPKNVYYTVSPKGFAFYRDLLVVVLIKFYGLFKSSKVFFHYHSSGVETFIYNSKINRSATNFFIKGVNIILISRFSKIDLSLVKGYSKIHFLSNGVEDKLSPNEFENILNLRESKDPIKVLYLSNMMKGKGYNNVLNLAEKYNVKHKAKFEFNFAGAWESENDKKYFNEFVATNNLEEVVTYHGLVHGKKKHNLYKEAHFFVFASKLNEVFPLVLLEALSYGLPILAFNKGGVPEIVTKDVGMLTTSKTIEDDLNIFSEDYLNKEMYLACRKKFLESYQLPVFESNLETILKEESIENYKN